MFSSGKNKNGCFDCDNCPREWDPEKDRFCVMWWEYTQMNDKGEQKISKGCGFRELPHFLTEVIKASNRPAAAIESIRNETLQAIRNHSLAMAIHLDKGFGNVKAIEEKKE